MVHIDTAEGSFDTLMLEGVMMGEGKAPDEFLVDYLPLVREWLAKTYDVSRPLVAHVSCLPFLRNSPIDLSVCGLVDDLFR